MKIQRTRAVKAKRVRPSRSRKVSFKTAMDEMFKEYGPVLKRLAAR